MSTLFDKCTPTNPTLEAKRLGVTFRQASGQWVGNEPAYELVCPHTGMILASDMTLMQAYEYASTGEFARIVWNFGYR